MNDIVSLFYLFIYLVIQVKDNDLKCLNDCRLFGLVGLHTKHDVAGSVPGTSTILKCCLALEWGPPAL